MNKKHSGLYIHFPFCSGKCNYCSFYSVKATEADYDNYVSLLEQSVEHWSEAYKNKMISTVYFGGGTPSVLGTDRLVKVAKKIYEKFSVDNNCEFTLEANPVSAQELDFNILKNCGVNRISLGMQSIHENELQLLGRRHRHTDLIRTLELIKNSGIENISLDVMLGIPEQTKESLRETLDFCIENNVCHVSTYILSVEKGTHFYKFKDKYSFADEELQAELYTFASDYLRSKGYTHYEISNFCKNDLYSRHNMSYWELTDYLGLGPSAHSLVDGKRFYYKHGTALPYCQNFVYYGEGGTKEEYIMLMLRTAVGVDFEKYKEKFGEALPQSVITKARSFEKAGYVKIGNNSIKLTPKGFLVSNAIIADLI